MTHTALPLVTTHPTVDVDGHQLALAPALECNATARTISGLVVPYGVQARRTGQGAVLFAAGSIRHHPDLSRIKLLIDHDPSQSVGYCTALAQSPEGVRATFAVAPGPAGDAALEGARADVRTRDGLSVGVDATMSHRSADGSHLVITQALLNEVSLVSLPAFSDARVLTVQASLAPDPADAPPAPADAPPAPALVPPAVAASTPVQSVAASALVPPAPYAPAGPIQAPAAGLATFGAVVERLSGLLTDGGGTAAQVQAALADIVPADDAGKGFLGQDEWLGELWTARKTVRPLVDLFNDGRELRRMVLHGWRWTTRPEVRDYAGNKTAIHSNKPATSPASATAYRKAGGWDVDRVFVDLGDQDILEALFAAALEDYLEQSEVTVQAATLAAATNVGNVTTAQAALKLLGQQAASIGARLGVVLMATDVWSTFLDIPFDQLPWWITAGNPRVSITEQEASIGGLTFAPSAALAAGQFLGADSRAAKFREKRLRVQALDVANGGVDLALYAYNAFLVQDARAIWKGTVGV